MISRKINEMQGVQGELSILGLVPSDARKGAFCPLYKVHYIFVIKSLNTFYTLTVFLLGYHLRTEWLHLRGSNGA